MLLIFTLASNSYGVLNLYQTFIYLLDFLLSGSTCRFLEFKDSSTGLRPSLYYINLMHLWMPTLVASFNISFLKRLMLFKCFAHALLLCSSFGVCFDFIYFRCCFRALFCSCHSLTFWLLCYGFSSVLLFQWLGLDLNVVIICFRKGGFYTWDMFRRPATILGSLLSDLSRAR